MALRIDTKLLIEHLHTLVNSSAKVCADSRRIQSGDIFFAYPVGHGSALRDGCQFIEAAFQNGAAAVVFDPAGIGQQWIDHPQCFAVDSLATKVGELSSQWYGQPSKDLNIIGVTGTNGKTSITQWLAQALDTSNHRTAVLGTLGSGFPGALTTTGYTTPDAPKLQTQLVELRNAGAQQVTMEVSSHALHQERISGTKFDCAVFTNLTQDHLDYHGSMVDYGEAKAKLFQQPGLKHAIINLDDTFGRELAMNLLAKENLKVWAYALSESVFSGFEKFGNRLQRIYARDTVLSGTGYNSNFICNDVGSAELHIPLLGEFNLSNALAVWAVLVSQGISCESAARKISHLTPVVGRMELIRLSKSQKADSLLAVVDYAHTPDALVKALQALRPMATQRGGKIWCVFGCGGDRDIGKRSLMGNIAERNSDHVLITSDNPRSEDPQAIMQMIRSGMSADAKNIQMIVDRAAAIMAAIRHADPRDIVLVAGKGHETTQELNGQKFEFSDQEHIRLAAGGGI
ncbi:UDP-N-acetylmuramoyl-L-alanyl-D-glutamate--2,6-diaminopimelate ligase [Polynucleobacter necessarius]|uniref:UDP-N-acetylmuramoyl-L-alanyl-D-glutamate--2, 6-diaminopimelate ligase n=1 Tax=Polynucleobacter necessarius TaxID=576610 RepID=UPI001E4C9C67|nr:UDP-N-acetylmuramoyl-L-alanyl-D-glutamate--2,6-diaminopimelate ligase [Polynucleobacter necessarius]